MTFVASDIYSNKIIEGHRFFQFSSFPSEMKTLNQVGFLLLELIQTTYTIVLLVSTNPQQNWAMKELSIILHRSKMSNWKNGDKIDKN